MDKASGKEKSLKETIYYLELALANRELEDPSENISDIFVEFGSSGRIFNKEDYLASLDISKEYYHYELIDLDIKIIGINTILATYKTINKGVTTLRSSIWKSKNETWQILFHQGTITAPENEMS
jgi:hypothetical protein